MDDADARIARIPPADRGLPDAPCPNRIRVWDPFVRVFHWLLAGLFLANFLELTPAGKLAHQIIGYVAVGLVLARIGWGFLGPRRARFSDFLRRPGETMRYLGSMMRGADQRHVGHNPAGGAMIVALLAGMLAIGLTGWLHGTDWLFGVEWVEDLHVALVNLLFAMVVAHVLGVIHASWRHRENLVAAMITGAKRPIASGQDAASDRRG